MSWKIKVNAKVTLNTPQIINKVTNDDFGLDVAAAWADLLSPYTPRDTGRLEDNAIITPFEIYYAPVDPETGKCYAADVYYPMYGKNLHRYPEPPASPPYAYAKRHERNPLSSHYWDKAAEQAGKKTELYSIINNQILK